MALVNRSQYSSIQLPGKCAEKSELSVGLISSILVGMDAIDDGFSGGGWCLTSDRLTAGLCPAEGAKGSGLVCDEESLIS
ncbi:hypothetical protein HOLleu_23162 [Holothuria leucospilota]|uniref:Uncharacterized protein n=1 Tax=Holothuria leucospilota TaxID=206669 RepID=A0A9Q1BUT5_HOLLE|nr:hypothetical protein HOLleu_23162 [Holothuria leucospilota]